MENGAITSNIDLAQVLIWAFWVFFFGLVFYLQRESRREGYPLETEDGRKENHGQFMGEPKAFKASFGPDEFLYSGTGERRDIPMSRSTGWLGDPYTPDGDPMELGVGAASYAMRHDIPEEDHHGNAKIRPMSKTEFEVGTIDDDPRGMTVYGHDGVAAGTCSDIWVDTAEHCIRYLEVDLGEGGKVLAPYTMTDIQGPKGILYLLLGVPVKNQGIFVNSLKGEHFAKVPRTKAEDTVTMLEEDKIMGYYGGGTLHSDPSRATPFL